MEIKRKPRSCARNINERQVKMMNDVSDAKRCVFNPPKHLPQAENWIHIEP